MVTTVIHYDTYSENGKMCDCSIGLEKCVSRTEGKIVSVRRLEQCVAFGVCPHILLRIQTLDSLNEPEKSEDENTIEKILNSSDEEIDIICKVFDKDLLENNPRLNRISHGDCFYWIHAAIMFKRRKVIQDVLPVLTEYQLPSFVWFTVQNWFSPLYLAVISEDEELSSILYRYNPKFFIQELRIYFPDRWKKLTVAISMIQRILSFDQVRALMTLLNASEMHNKKILKTSLECALQTGARSCITYLLEKGARLDQSNLEANLNNTIHDGDINIMSQLLNSHRFQVNPRLLTMAVNKGQMEIVQCLLDHMPKDLKHSFGIKFQTYQDYSACLVEAVLNNSVDIVKALINKNLNVKFCLSNLSALKWARILQYNDIESLLVEAGAESFTENGSENICAFNSVLTVHERNEHMVKRLLAIGEDVNDDIDGTPPFYTTMGLRRYDIMQELLLCGANPYLKRETWKYFLIRLETPESWRSFLHVFVRVNVTLSCDTKITLLEYICDRSTLSNKANLCRLILQCAHSLIDKDITILKENRCKMNSDIAKTEIEDYLFKPRSLSVFCRNSIRRKFGQNIHRYIEIMKPSLPTRFIDFLNCNDVLEKFYTDKERKEIAYRF